MTGKDWDEGCCPGCGGRGPGASAATPAGAPRPRPDPADPEDPEEEEGFTLEEEDDLLDFPGIAEGSRRRRRRQRRGGVRNPGEDRRGVPTAHRVSPGSLDGLLGGLGVTQGRDDPDIGEYSEFENLKLEERL